MKKIITVLLALSVFVCSSGFTSINQSQDSSVKDSSVKDSSVNAILETDLSLIVAKKVAQDTINSSIGTEGCKWNKNTKLDDSVALYDLNDKVNAYLFRPKTNGKQQGHILIDTISEAKPIAEMYSFSGESYIDHFMRQQKGRASVVGDKLLYLGGFECIIKSGTELYDLESNQEITKSKNEITEEYANQLTNNATWMKEDLATKSSLAVSSIPSAYSLPKVSSWSPYTTSYFGDPNNCAPTACTNFMYYWGNLHPNKQPALWTGSVYQDLKSDIQYDPNSGTGWDETYAGIPIYADSRNTPTAGDDFKIRGDFDWNWISTNLAHNLPLLVKTNKIDGQGWEHMMLGLGYTSSQTIRTADGWDADTNFYLAYNNLIEHVGYYRW